VVLETFLTQAPKLISLIAIAYVCNPFIGKLKKSIASSLPSRYDGH